MSVLAAAMRLALFRLRSPRLAVVALLALAAVAWVGTLERAETPVRAVDYTLFGVVFGWTLPLLTYVITGAVLRHARLDDAVLPVARAGGNRRVAALGLLAPTAAVMATLAGLLAVAGVFSARGRLDAAAVADAGTSACIAALGGAVYVVGFGLGSLFGRAGGGRAAALLIDWVLGTGHALAAVAWPRAHLGSLIGGEAVMGLSSPASALSLCGLVSAYLAVMLVRLRR